MISTAEEIIENVRALPISERERFFDLAETEKQKILAEKAAKNIELEKKNERFQRALQWIEKNREKYDGQWVALDGDKLLAHGTDGKQVHADAQAKGVKTPLMHRVSLKETQPFGGW